MKGLNPSEVIKLYIEHERKIQHDVPNATRFADENVVRYVYDGSRPGFICFYQANTLTIDELIDREVAFFKKLGKSFEWKTYATDEPADIGKRLLTKGFVADDTESFLVRSIQDYQPELTLPNGVTCKSVISKQMFRDSFEIQNTEFPFDVNEHVEKYWEKFGLDDNSTIYNVYENGKPVSTARVDFTPNSPFAGLYAGTTLTPYRGKGYYQLLLNYRIAEAKRRGRNYITIDALETSRPIVEKHGFQFITTTTPYVFTSPNPTK